MAAPPQTNTSVRIPRLASSESSRRNAVRIWSRPRSSDTFPHPGGHEHAVTLEGDRAVPQGGGSQTGQSGDKPPRFRHPPGIVGPCRYRHAALGAEVLDDGGDGGVVAVVSGERGRVTDQQLSAGAGRAAEVVDELDQRPPRLGLLARGQAVGDLEGHLIGGHCCRPAAASRPVPGAPSRARLSRARPPGHREPPAALPPATVSARRAGGSPRSCRPEGGPLNPERGGRRRGGADWWHPPPPPRQQAARRARS